MPTAAARAARSDRFAELGYQPGAWKSGEEGEVLECERILERIGIGVSLARRRKRHLNRQLIGARTANSGSPVGSSIRCAGVVFHSASTLTCAGTHCRSVVLLVVCPAPGVGGADVVVPAAWLSRSVMISVSRQDG